MGNGGLRHAHPGGVVVDAHIFKKDGPDHFLLVRGELPDCGVEPVVETWSEFVCPVCGQVFDSEQRCQKHAASCQAGWLMELASYLGCVVRLCGERYRFFGLVVDTVDYVEKVTADGVYIYYDDRGLTLEPKVLNIPMGSVEVISHEAAVKEAVALAGKIAGDVFDRMLKEASQ